jgi:hypothetical protein
LPNFNLIRPADAEVLGAWEVAIESNQGDGVADGEVPDECRPRLGMDRIFNLWFAIPYRLYRVSEHF